MRVRRLTLDDPLAPTPTRTDTALPASDHDRVGAERSPGNGHAPDTGGPLEAPAGRLRTVPLDRVIPNPGQPRHRFDDEALQALADSIAQRGILQPPVVRTHADGKLELIAGERRWRAARIAGLTELEVLVTDADDTQALQDALVENVLRENLSPVEQARSYATLIDDLGITREELGRRLGQSRVSISNHLRLLDLPDDVLELLDTKQLPFAHGRALLLCDDNDTRRKLARRAVAEGWSKRALEDAARAAGAPRVKRPASSLPDAEHRALAQLLSDAVSRATGLEVSVKPCGVTGYAFTIDGADAARALAGRLGWTEPEAEL